jgi:threonine dehydrogenase-like Zn-dependent dehydrogenase
MKSWLLTKPRTFSADEHESRPLESASEAKVKIDAGFVSATDLRLYNGLIKKEHYPIVPGRQGAGVVSEVLEENDCCLEKGDRVIIDPFLPCGICLYCRTNRTHLCNNGKMLGVNIDGLYTNFKILNCSMLHKIPEHMSNTTALFTEYVAMALTTIDKMDLQEGDHVAIFSANKLGFIMAQLVTYYQGIAIVIDSEESQLEKLKNEGVGLVINPKTTDLRQAVTEITGGRNCEKVVFIANSTMQIKDAIDCCAHNGVMCLAGCVPTQSQGDFGEIHRKQITVVSTMHGYKNFPSAINLLATKTVRINPLLGSQVKFEDIPEMFEKLDFEKTRYTSTEIVID